MLKFSPKCGNEWDGTDWGEGRNLKNWGVERKVINVNGKPVHGPDGAVLKEKVPMCNAEFTNGSPQLLYYPEGHTLAGVFKGMGVILEECGFDGALKIYAECLSFKCDKATYQCWGYSKWIYHEYPTSSKEANLEHNVLASLNAVLIKVMHRCVQSLLFLISCSSQSL
jgi:hypothetical protein